MVSKKEDQCTYTMHEEGIERELGVLQEEKDLGVMFDPTLWFSKHVSMVANKANRILGVMKRTFSFMDNKDAHNIIQDISQTSCGICKLCMAPFLTK